MLVKPPECIGCPLHQISSGFMRPSLARFPNGVALLGEALGADEAEAGSPFVGKAGFRLTRLIEWAGFERGDFDIYNAAWCRPPDNKLEGLLYEAAAIAHCKAAHWGSYLQAAKVVVPMGNVATSAVIGKKGILSTRGYVYPGMGNYVIPTVHPSFIQRGQSRWSAAFINDLQKAVTLAKDGMPPQLVDYTLDPSPLAAYRWAEDYIRQLGVDPRVRLAFDIETPGKPEAEDEADPDSDAPDRTWNIERIGFAYRPLHALSIPWEPAYKAAIHLLLGSAGDKVVWNAGFDVPRVRRAGVDIRGVCHDGMVAWHILHTDLPKRLGFVATFTCPWQPAWKHLSGTRPAFYNATDADVELRSMLHIEEQLRRNDLWDVYQHDVLDLEPILVHMHERGMPIDAETRLDRSRRLAERQAEARDRMEHAVPVAARRIERAYTKTPVDTTGLYSRPGTRSAPVCTLCGQLRPKAAHFRKLKKKPNPCADAVIGSVQEEFTEWYRLAEFSPSRQQLTSYHRVMNRDLPMVWDNKAKVKKVSFGEKQLTELRRKYPEDQLYPAIMDYRRLDKIAGTYIGRPSDEPG